MNCRLCGRTTGDRHWVCWRCRRGLAERLEREPDRNATVCQCAVPEPYRIDGFLAGLAALECRQCGRAVVADTPTGSPAP